MLRAVSSTQGLLVRLELAVHLHQMYYTMSYTNFNMIPATTAQVQDKMQIIPLEIISLFETILCNPAFYHALPVLRCPSAALKSECLP